MTAVGGGAAVQYGRAADHRLKLQRTSAAPRVEQMLLTRSGQLLACQDDFSRRTIVRIHDMAVSMAQSVCGSVRVGIG